VRIWNTALTDTQILNNVGINLSQQTGLVGYYDMKDGSQTLTDLSSSVSTTQNNGVLGTTSSAETTDPAWLTTAQVTCNVKGNFRLNFDSSFTPDSTAMLTEHAIDEIKVYPNPSSGGFYVKMNSEKNLSFKISTATGVTVSSKSDLISNKTYLVGTELSPGVYLLTIEGPYKKKVVKLIKH